GGCGGAGQPRLFPELPAEAAFVHGQRRLVRIDVDLIGEDANPQFLAAVGGREEARFQTHRQQQQRMVRRREHRGELGRQRGGGERGRIGGRGQQRHGQDPISSEAWIATRIGSCRRIRAMCAALNAQVVPAGSAWPAGGAASGTCVAVPKSISTSKPKRGSVGCCWMTKYQPGSPTATAGSRSKPKNVTSGCSAPRKRGCSSAACAPGLRPLPSFTAGTAYTIALG